MIHAHFLTLMSAFCPGVVKKTSRRDQGQRCRHRRPVVIGSAVRQFSLRILNDNRERFGPRRLRPAWM